MRKRVHKMNYNEQRLFDPLDSWMKENNSNENNMQCYKIIPDTVY